MYIGLHVKYPLFLPDFDETWIFLTEYANITFHENPEGAELFHAYRQPDRQTDRQTDRKTDRQKDREKDRQRDRRDEANSCF